MCTICKRCNWNQLSVYYVMTSLGLSGHVGLSELIALRTNRIGNTPIISNPYILDHYHQLSFSIVPLEVTESTSKVNRLS